MTLNLVKLCLFSLFIATTYSCNSDDNSTIIQPNPFEKFKGNWQGTYTGDANGTWTATFNENGIAEGTLVSGSSTFKLTAEVNENGIINAEYKSGTTVVGTMTGTLTDKTGLGTWVNTIQNYTGTWQGTKN